MESDAFTLYKLIILFLLNKVDFPLTNSQISNFILEKGYTNYFNIQQSISELMEAEFINMESIGHNSYYKINDEGRETLSFFDNMISSAIREEIIDYLKENQYSLRNETSILAEYFDVKKGDFMARLRVLEKGEPIIDLSISVPTENEASKLCNNWKTESQKIYAFVLSTLLKEEDGNNE
jgi:DNA-binding PadR family transcriptional regulator